MSHRDKWNARYAGRELVWSATPNALLVEQVEHLKPARALDVACGEGRNALWLAAHGWQVTAVDFSDVAIDKARTIAAHRGVEVNWIAADVLDMDLAPQSFELVAVVFLHTDPQSRANWLPKAIDAVVPGGTFIYIGHDPENIDKGVGGPQDPQFLPSHSEVCTALTEFQIERAEVVERAVDADPGHGAAGPGTAYDTLVHAVRISA